MPFIDSKVTVKMSDAQKETLKSSLGQAITTMNKTESYLMVGINDGYDLFMGGKKLDKGAYVEVSVFGDVTPKACDAMTGKICDIFGKRGRWRAGHPAGGAGAGDRQAAEPGSYTPLTMPANRDE